MSSRKSKAADVSRREFLVTMGASIPTISLLDAAAAALPSPAPRPDAQIDSRKFTPVELAKYFNSSSKDFGVREHSALISGDSSKDYFIRAWGGKRSLQGIPFSLGPEDVASKRWLVLSSKSAPAVTSKAEVPVAGKASFLCLTSFCDSDPNEDPKAGVDVFQKVGQRLAEVTLIYEDGGTHVLPLRRRFETHSVVNPWGHLSFTALPSGALRPTKLTDPLDNAIDWGPLQTTVGGSRAGDPDMGMLWVCALENPEPDRTIRAVRFEGTAEDVVVICGMTLYRGEGNPLRTEPRAIYRITLPEAAAKDESRWRVDVDLGTVARTYALPDFNPEAWLAKPDKGLGERVSVNAKSRYLYTEVLASLGATLRLSDTKTGKHYAFDLAKVGPGSELQATEGGGSIEIVEQGRRWVHFRVLDTESQQPTPVRLALRSKEGRYIAPYGHRSEVNDAWFQDYGADLKLMDSSFAYVDGTFQVQLPAGELYVEMTKGFEHEAVRQKIDIKPGQREVTLEIPRFTNLRSQGWVTADMHTHFLSPSTAVLEAQAEGLNLINLLAAQWGDLFTNVGDLSHGPLLSADRESMVWVGTENRHHILGHIGLEGVQGKPVFPMSSDGPEEAYLGDPLWSSLAEWADTARERKGLAVAVHFPYPTGEIAADIVLGKIDALEIWPKDINLYEDKVRPSPVETFTTLAYLDWYHYLNCGYRLPAVAGTDKMGAYIPAGANRVYAYLGQEEFNYPNFSKAVKSGNTFASSGPLLMLHADGRPPGAEITLGAGGGTIEVVADAKCFVPIHRLEIIFNGRVVASSEEKAGAKTLRVSEKIKVEGPGWFAARCSSHSGPISSWRFKIAAHTSPVYVKIPGRELFSPEAATYFLQLIDGAQSYIETLATRSDDETLAPIRKVYADAREEIHRRMHQHGIPH